MTDVIERSIAPHAHCEQKGMLISAGQLAPNENAYRQALI